MSRYTFVLRGGDRLPFDGELLVELYVQPDPDGGDPLMVGPCQVSHRDESWHSWGPPETAELRL